MPPPNDPMAAALTGIQTSAAAIFDERKRLNDAFAALQTAVQTIKPGWTLSDKGELVSITGDVEAPPKVVPPTEEELAVGGHEPPTIRAQIIEHLSAGKRMTSPALAREIGKAEGSIRAMLSKMGQDGQVVRVVSGGVPYFMLAAPVTRRTEGETQGASAPSSPPATESKAPPSGEKPSTPSTTTQPAPSEATQPEPSSRNGRGHGLARSPKPRAEMRTQQREAEERVDALIRWAAEQPERQFNAVDGAEDFGIDRTKFAADCRTLKERGVLVQIGSEWSRAALSGPVEKRGRQTVKYRLAPDVQIEEATRPKALAPLTEERVRDAAIHIGEFDIRALAYHLGLKHEPLVVKMLHAHVDTLVKKGILVPTDGSNGDRTAGPRSKAVHWRYEKPTDEGAGARLERQRRQRYVDTLHEQMETPRRTEGAVAGTGKKMSAGAKEVQDIINACIRQLGRDKVQKAGNNHYAIHHPDAPGGRVMIASTPNSSGLIKDKAKLRKLGIVGI